MHNHPPRGEAEGTSAISLPRLLDDVTRWLRANRSQIDRALLRPGTPEAEAWCDHLAILHVELTAELRGLEAVAPQARHHAIAARRRLGQVHLGDGPLDETLPWFAPVPEPLRRCA